MKLFNYPVQVVDNIIVLLDPIPLISLSFCSRKTKERIKKVSFAIEDAWFGHEYKKDKGLFFEMKFPRTNIELIVDFQPPPEGIETQLESLSVKIEDLLYDCRYKIDEQKVYVDCAEYDKAFIFFNYILDLVRAGITHITINLNKIVDAKQFISKPCFENVRKVFVIGGYAFSKKTTDLYDRFEKPLLYARFLPKLFTGISPNCKIFQADHLLFNHAYQVIEREHLLNLNSMYISLRVSTLDTDDIIAFLKQWLEGNNTRLCAFSIHSRYENGTFDRQKILEAVGAGPWDPTKRSQNFIYDSPMYNKTIIDCSYDDDIERSDGLLATLRFTPCNRAFHFYVWHNRFNNAQAKSAN
ncbi:unnamed protein product [Caenorhabditis brenneri]